MPQQVQVPDVGIVEFPDNFSDDQIVHAIKKDALLRQMDTVRGEDRGSAWLARQNQSPEGLYEAGLQGVQRGTGEAIKGVGTLAEIAPTGFSSDIPGIEALAPPEFEQTRAARAARTQGQTYSDLQSNPLFVAGRALEETAPESHPIPPKEQESFLTKTAESMGGFVPLVASGPLAPATIGLQTVGAHITNDYDAEKAKGKSDEAAAKTAMDRAVTAGGLQATIFAVLPAPLRKLGDKYLIDKFGGQVARFLAARAAQAGEGAALGGTSQVAENVVEGQPIGQGVPESAAGLALLQAGMPRGPSRAEQEMMGAPAEGLSPEAQALLATIPPRLPRRGLRNIPGPRRIQAPERTTRVYANQEQESGLTERPSREQPTPEETAAQIISGGQGSGIAPETEIEPSQTYAIQIQGADAQVLRNPQPDVGLPQVGAGNVQSEISATTKTAQETANQAGVLAALPPVKPGFVRMFHGGADPRTDLNAPRDITPLFDYAAGYASKSGQPVWYVDVPEDAPYMKKGFEEFEGGPKAPYINTVAPAEVMKGAKLVTETKPVEPTKPPEPAPAPEPAPPPQSRTEGEAAPTQAALPVEVQPKPSEGVSGGPAAPEPVAGPKETRLTEAASIPKGFKKYAQSPTLEGVKKHIAKFYGGESKELVPDLANVGHYSVVSESTGKPTGSTVVQTKRGFYFGKTAEAPAPAPKPEPAQAVEKVKAEIESVAKTEGQRPAKEVKSELVQRLKDAVESAPANADFHPITGKGLTEAAKKAPATVTIQIPGDGDFTIINRKENISEVLVRANRVSMSSGTAKKLASVGDPSETEIDTIAKAYGSAENAYRSVKRQKDTLQSQDPPTTVEERAVWNQQIQNADYLLKKLYEKTSPGILEAKAEAARERVQTYESGAEGFRKEIARVEAIKKKTPEHKHRLEDLQTRYAQNQEFIQTNTKNAEQWEQQAAKEKAALEAPPTHREQAETLAQSLEKAKVDLGGGQLHAFGVVPDLWNRAVGVVQAAIRAGGSLADAIEAGIKYIKDNFKGTWDEAGARNALGNIVQPKRRNRQVMGVRQGPEQEVENIARQKDAIQEHLFSGDAPVSPETTANAWSMAEELSGENKGQHTATIGSIVRDATGMESSDMAPALVQVELRNYALKLAAKGDRSLMDYLVKKRMGVIDPEAALDPTQLGRGLRALAESMGPFWKNVLRITADRAAAAGRALGVGKELFNKLMDTVESLTVSPDEFKKATDTVKTPKGKTMDDLLGPEFNPESETSSPAEAAREKSNFQREAERIMAQEEQKAYGAEWIKPEAKLSVRKIINEFLATKPPVGMPTSFEGTFKHELMSRIMADPLNVSRPVAHRIASAVFDNLQARMITRQQRLMERAATPNRYGEYGKLSNLIEQMLATPYRAQHDPAWRMETAANWFMSRGLSRDHAEAAAQLFSKQFETALQQAAERQARRLLESKFNPETISDVIKAIRLGLTDPSRHWADDLAAREGFKPLSAEDQKRVAELEVKSTDENLSPPELKHVLEKMMRIFRHSGLPMDNVIARRWSESFVAKFLSGVKTFFVQLAPVFEAMRDFPHLAVAFRRPKDAIMLFTAMKNGYVKAMLPEFRVAWKNKAYGFHIDEIEREHSALQTWWESLEKEAAQTKDAGKLAWIRVRQLEASHHYVSHFLNSIDQAQMSATREWKLVSYGFDAFNLAGIPVSRRGDLIDAMARARQATFEEALSQGVDPLTAKVRANYFAERGIHEFFSEFPEAEGLAAQVIRAAENDYYATVGRKSEGIKEHDEGFVSIPMNHVLEFVSKMRAEGGAMPILATSVFGFVNIPWRTTKYASQYLPYGFLRYGIHRYRTTPGKQWIPGMKRNTETFWKQTMGTELQAREVLRKAIAGTVVMGLASAWSAYHSTTDDKAGSEEFSLYITGAGPQNRGLKEQWIKAGWKPYALNFIIHGHKVRIPLTRVGEAIMFPFILAAAHDDAQWKVKEAVAAGHAPPAPISNYVGTLIGEIFSMAGQKGILQGPAQMYEVVRGGSGWIKGGAKLAGTVASGLILPYKQLLASISEMFVGPLDQSTATAILANNLPIVGLIPGAVGKLFGKDWAIQHVGLNRFGDPLYDRSWYGRMDRTGIPIAFQVSKNPENERLYNDLLLQKGVAPPALLLSTLEKRYGPLTNDQFARFSAISGQNLKQETLSNADGLQALPSEDVKKFLNQAATRANDIAAAQMGLERVKPSTREVAAGPAPAATGQRLPSSTPSLAGATGAVEDSSRISGIGPRRIGLPRVPGGLGRRLSGLGRVGTPRIGSGGTGRGRRLVTGRLRSRGGGRSRRLGRLPRRRIRSHA